MLRRPEIAAVDLAEFDDEEPFVLENALLEPADVALLAGVAVSTVGCEFNGCDLSALSFHGVRKTRFVSCKLRGTRFTKHVRESSLDDCVLAESGFRVMTLEHVAFRNCQLTGCDFYGSDLRELTFDGSSVEGIGFDACTLEDVDLSAARDLLISDPRTLKGAKVRESQVPSFGARLAQLSGIEVVSD